MEILKAVLIGTGIISIIAIFLYLLFAMIKKLKERRKAKDKKKRYKTYTKRWLTFILINGVIWIYLSYVLAFLDKIQIAETLSVTAVTSIIATMIGYFCKSAFEKKIGKEKEEYEDLFEKDIQ